MGNIESIETAYLRTKEYIVYDSFKTIMTAIVLFLVLQRMYEELHKNITQNNQRIDMGTYWSQIRILVLVCLIATSSGAIFKTVESVGIDLQTALINKFGGDSSSKSLDTMTDLVRKQVIEVQAKEAEGMTLDIPVIGDIIWKSLTGVVMAIGVFIFKWTYTFFILGRYMWLLMLELVAPIAIVLIVHENTRSYFYSWLKNMIICYLLIPFFLLADRFSNEVAGFFMEGCASAGQASVFIVVCVGVWVKIKMFSTVRSKSSQLF